MSDVKRMSLAEDPGTPCHDSYCSISHVLLSLCQVASIELCKRTLMPCG